MDISDLLQPKKAAVSTPQRLPVRAVVSTPPATLDAPTMRVLVPGHSSDYDAECRWVRQGDAIPAAGVDCLVVYDETGAGTVVAWEGAGVSLLAIAAAIDARLDALEATRTIRGTVSSAGAVVLGTGFTASRTGAGQYTVTVTAPFSGTPSVVVSAGTTVANYSAKLISRAAGSFSVNTITIAASPANVDGEFDFIARGPA